jgi:hypothetical protein
MTFTLLVATRFFRATAVGLQTVRELTKGPNMSSIVADHGLKS